MSWISHEAAARWTFFQHKLINACSRKVIEFGDHSDKLEMLSIFSHLNVQDLELLSCVMREFVEDREKVERLSLEQMKNLIHAYAFMRNDAALSNEEKEDSGLISLDADEVLSILELLATCVESYGFDEGSENKEFYENHLDFLLDCHTLAIPLKLTDTTSAAAAALDISAESVTCLPPSMRQPSTLQHLLCSDTCYDVGVRQKQVFNMEQEHVTKLEGGLEMVTKHIGGVKHHVPTESGIVIDHLVETTANADTKRMNVPENESIAVMVLDERCFYRNTGQLTGHTMWCAKLLQKQGHAISLISLGNWRPVRDHEKAMFLMRKLQLVEEEQDLVVFGSDLY